MDNERNYDYKQNDFSYFESYNKNPSSINFKLHNHNNNFEILLFKHGNGEFRVEGTTYYPTENDVLITQSNEMHRMILKSDEPYMRTVININNDFFSKNRCETLNNVFLNHPLGVDNLIHANRQLLDAFKRMDEYINDEKNNGGDNSVVVRSVLIELLYILNKNNGESQGNHYSENISNIVIYINEHLTEPLSLDRIADEFYMSKYHLCHTFKNNTGFSVNKYISYKRILMVQELCEKGCTLTEAAVNAGFGNYSNFYRIFLLQTGTSPRNGIKFKG